MKFKSIVTLFSSLLLVNAAAAEEAAAEATSPWTPTLGFALAFSQVDHNNWVSKGENSINWNVLFDGTMLGTFGKNQWNNELHLGYGQSKIGDRASRKSLDKMQAESRYSYHFTSLFSGYTGAHLESQWTKSFDYDDDNNTKKAMSDYWDPGYLTLGIGVGYTPHPLIKNRIGFAYKNTWGSKYFGWADDPDTDRVETWRGEPGLEYILSLLWTKGDMLELKSKFSLFANFEGVEEVDLRWENSAKANFSKYFAVALGFEMLYDKDLSEDLQQRNSVSVQLQYNLF